MRCGISLAAESQLSLEGGDIKINESGMQFQCQSWFSISDEHASISGGFLPQKTAALMPAATKTRLCFYAESKEVEFSYKREGALSR